MSPLLLVGILAIASTNADVSHVLDGSAKPPQTNDINPEAQAINCLAHTPAGSFASSASFAGAGTVPGPNFASANAGAYAQAGGLIRGPEGNYPIQGDQPFWWADANSPFKHAYEHFKKCSLKGNCLPPVAPNFAPNAFDGASVPQLDIKKNPFFNGQFQGVAISSCTGTSCKGGKPGTVITTCKGGDCKSTSVDTPEGSPDLRSNPFLNGGTSSIVYSGKDGFVGTSVSAGAGTININKNPFFNGNFNAGKTVTSVTGDAINADQGFLGVQPVQPFSKDKKPFPTTYPTGQQSLNQGAQPFPVNGNKKPFPTVHPGGQSDLSGSINANPYFKTDGIGQENTGLSCKDSGYICVAKELCSNGAVNLDGRGLYEVGKKTQYCDAAKETCCKVGDQSSDTQSTDGPNTIISTGQFSSSSASASSQAASSTFSSSKTYTTSPESNAPNRFASINDLNQITAGKSSVPGSSIKFGGVAGFSPGTIQVIQEGQATEPRPVISFAGDTGSDQSSSASTNKPTRQVFNTVDYSNANFEDDVRFSSGIQGPQYLPPVPSPTTTTPKPIVYSPTTQYLPPSTTPKIPDYSGKPDVPVTNYYSPTTPAPSSYYPTTSAPATTQKSFSVNNQYQTPSTREYPTASIEYTPSVQPLNTTPKPSSPFVPPSSPAQPIPPSTQSFSSPSTYQYFPPSTPQPFYPSPSSVSVNNQYVPPSTPVRPSYPSPSTFTNRYEPPSTPQYIPPSPKPPPRSSYPSPSSVSFTKEYLPPSTTQYVPPSTTPRPQPPTPRPVYPSLSSVSVTKEYLPPSTPPRTYPTPPRTYPTPPRTYPTPPRTYPTTQYIPPSTTPRPSYPSPSSVSTSQYLPPSTPPRTYPTPPRTYQTTQYVPPSTTPRPSYPSPSSVSTSQYLPPSTPPLTYPTPPRTYPTTQLVPSSTTPRPSYPSPSSVSPNQYLPPSTPPRTYPTPPRTYPTTQYVPSSTTPRTYPTPFYTPTTPPVYIPPSTTQRPYTPRPSPSTTPQVYVPPVTPPRPPSTPPNPTGGYIYNKPTPEFNYPSSTEPNLSPEGSININNQYLYPKPPVTPSTATDSNIINISVIPNKPDNTGAENKIPGTFVRPTTPRRPVEQNTAPPPGCAAALKCVQEIYCTAEGVISPVPVILTKEQELSRVPTTVCADQESGIIGKCCRDPYYKDPWPSANLVNGVDDGQYKEDPNLGQYFPGKQRQIRSGPRVTNQNPPIGNSPQYVAPVSDQPTCGERHFNTQPKGPNPLDVNFAEIPWQAMILRDTNRSLLCGGVIIKRDVVLTAAHCVEGLDTRDVLIKGGEWKLGIDEEPLPFQIVKVSVIVRHPDYQPGSYVNDLALLILEEKLRLAKNIGTLCLPKPNEIPTQNCIATGWGKRILQLHAKGAIMHSIDVKVMDQKQCQDVISNKYSAFLPNYSPNTICGFSDIDQCKVDYGSALACSSGNGRYTLSGVYAWDTGCRDPGQIGGYVAPDVEWIDSCLAKPVKELRKLERAYTSQYRN